MTSQLPEVGFLRIWQIIGDSKTPAIVPVSRSSWYAGIKSGKYPKPCKLSERISAWKVEDIRSLVHILDETRSLIVE